MNRLKLGIIGSGFIARFQTTALKSVSGMELCGVHSRSSGEAFVSWAREEGAPDCVYYATISELCNQCDVVAVFAPNFARLDHVGEILNAVKSGAQLKGIICEKPLGRTVSEARQVVAMAKEAGLPTAYFENQIHMKAIKSALAQLKSVQENMGPLSLARSAEEHAGPHNPWFWDPTQQGGGVLSDMGCHSIAVGWYALTPPGKPVRFLEPIRVSAETALLKWGTPVWRKKLLERMGIDYAKTPAEDFATGMITFQNPESGQQVKAQFTNSWMYDKQGLRLLMDGLGPGYAFEINSLQSPLSIFIGDEAAAAVEDAEGALEKATASRGLLSVQPNEADLYGYVDELEDARDSFLAGHDALLNWDYGLEITKLCQAAYMAAERGQTLDLRDASIQKDLETYVSLIAQGRGLEILNPQ